MVAIITRAAKGSELTYSEVDENFNNLKAAADTVGTALLGSAVASNTAFIDFSNLDTTLYSSFLLICDAVIPAVHGDYFGVRGKVGSTVVSGAADYSNEGVRSTAAGTSGVDGAYTSGIYLHGITEMLGNADNQNYFSESRISFARRMDVLYRGRGLMSSGSYVTCTGGGGNYSATGINGLRIYCYNGNIASGSFKLYGSKA